MLLNFTTFSSAKDAYHYSTYALAGGIPAALLFGSPISNIVDVALGVVLPLHAHFGVRSVIVDYVHDATNQRLAVAVLGGVTVLTELGLTKFNLTDVGLTEGVKMLFEEQPPPKSLIKAAAAVAKN